MELTKFDDIYGLNTKNKENLHINWYRSLIDYALGQNWHCKRDIQPRKTQEVNNSVAEALLRELKKTPNNTISWRVFEIYIYLSNLKTWYKKHGKWPITQTKTCLNSLQIYPKLEFRLINRCLFVGYKDIQEKKRKRLWIIKQKFIQNCLTHLCLIKQKP